MKSQERKRDYLLQKSNALFLEKLKSSDYAWINTIGDLCENKEIVQKIISGPNHYFIKRIINMEELNNQEYLKWEGFERKLYWNEIEAIKQISPTFALDEQSTYEMFYNFFKVNKHLLDEKHINASESTTGNPNIPYYLHSNFIFQHMGEIQGIYFKERMALIEILEYIILVHYQDNNQKLPQVETLFKKIEKLCNGNISIKIWEIYKGYANMASSFGLTLNAGFQQSFAIQLIKEQVSILGLLLQITKFVPINSIINELFTHIESTHFTGFFQAFSSYFSNIQNPIPAETLRFFPKEITHLLFNIIIASIYTNPFLKNTSNNDLTASLGSSQEIVILVNKMSSTESIFSALILLAIRILFFLSNKSFPDNEGIHLIESLNVKELFESPLIEMENLFVGNENLKNICFKNLLSLLSGFCMLFSMKDLQSLENISFILSKLLENKICLEQISEFDFKQEKGIIYLINDLKDTFPLKHVGRNKLSSILCKNKILAKEIFNLFFSLSSFTTPNLKINEEEDGIFGKNPSFDKLPSNYHEILNFPAGTEITFLEEFYAYKILYNYNGWNIIYSLGFDSSQIIDDEVKRTAMILICNLIKYYPKSILKIKASLSNKSSENQMIILESNEMGESILRDIIDQTIISSNTSEALIPFLIDAATSIINYAKSPVNWKIFESSLKINYDISNEVNTIRINYLISLFQNFFILNKEKLSLIAPSIIKLFTTLISTNPNVTLCNNSNNSYTKINLMFALKNLIVEYSFSLSIEKRSDTRVLYYLIKCILISINRIQSFEHNSIIKNFIPEISQNDSLKCIVEFLNSIDIFKLIFSVIKYFIKIENRNFNSYSDVLDKVRNEILSNRKEKKLLIKTLINSLEILWKGFEIVFYNFRDNQQSPSITQSLKFIYSLIDNFGAKSYQSLNSFLDIGNGENNNLIKCLLTIFHISLNDPKIFEIRYNPCRDDLYIIKEEKLLNISELALDCLISYLVWHVNINHENNLIYYSLDDNIKIDLKLVKFRKIILNDLINILKFPDTNIHLTSKIINLLTICVRSNYLIIDELISQDSNNSSSILNTLLEARILKDIKNIELFYSLILFLKEITLNKSRYREIMNQFIKNNSFPKTLKEMCEIIIGRISKKAKAMVKNIVSIVKVQYFTKFLSEVYIFVLLLISQSANKDFMALTLLLVHENLREIIPLLKYYELVSDTCNKISHLFEGQNSEMNFMNVIEDMIIQRNANSDLLQVTKIENIDKENIYNKLQLFNETHFFNLNLLISPLEVLNIYSSYTQIEREEFLNLLPFINSLNIQFICRESANNLIPSMTLLLSVTTNETNNLFFPKLTQQIRHSNEENLTILYNCINSLLDHLLERKGNNEFIIDIIHTKFCLIFLGQFISILMTSQIEADEKLKLQLNLQILISFVIKLNSLGSSLLISSNKECDYVLILFLRIQENIYLILQQSPFFSNELLKEPSNESILLSIKISDKMTKNPKYYFEACELLLISLKLVGKMKMENLMKDFIEVNVNNILQKVPKSAETKESYSSYFYLIHELCFPDYGFQNILNIEIIKYLEELIQSINDMNVVYKNNERSDDNQMFCFISYTIKIILCNNSYSKMIQKYLLNYIHLNASLVDFRLKIAGISNNVQLYSEEKINMGILEELSIYTSLIYDMCKFCFGSMEDTLLISIIDKIIINIPNLVQGDVDLTKIYNPNSTFEKELSNIFLNKENKLNGLQPVFASVPAKYFIPKYEPRLNNELKKSRTFSMNYGAEYTKIVTNYNPNLFLFQCELLLLQIEYNVVQTLFIILFRENFLKDKILKNLKCKTPDNKSNFWQVLDNKLFQICLFAIHFLDKWDKKLPLLDEMNALLENSKLKFSYSRMNSSFLVSMSTSEIITLCLQICSSSIYLMIMLLQENHNYNFRYCRTAKDLRIPEKWMDIAYALDKYKVLKSERIEKIETDKESNNNQSSKDLDNNRLYSILMEQALRNFL